MCLLRNCRLLRTFSEVSHWWWEYWNWRFYKDRLQKWSRLTNGEIGFRRGLSIPPKVYVTRMDKFNGGTWKRDRALNVYEAGTARFCAGNCTWKYKTSCTVNVTSCTFVHNVFKTRECCRWMDGCQWISAGSLISKGAYEVLKRAMESFFLLYDCLTQRRQATTEKFGEDVLAHLPVVV